MVKKSKLGFRELFFALDIISMRDSSLKEARFSTSLGISASGLVLYFFDGGSFDDLVKPPTIDFYQLNLNANSIN